MKVSTTKGVAAAQVARLAQSTLALVLLTAGCSGSDVAPGGGTTSGEIPDGSAPDGSAGSDAGAGGAGGSAPDGGVDAGWQGAWLQSLTSHNWDEPGAVARDQLGNVVVVGTMYLQGLGPSAVVLKVDQEGSLLWQHAVYGTSLTEGKSVAACADGGLLVAARTYAYGAGNFDMLILRFDAAGQLGWQKTIGGPEHDSPSSIIELSDGDIALTGRTASFGSGVNDGYLARLSAAGEPQWQVLFGGTGDDEGRQVIETADHDLVVVGTSGSQGPGPRDVWLLRFDPLDGSIRWQQAFGGAEIDLGSGVVELSSGELLAVGSTLSLGLAGWFDALMIRVASDGTPLEQRTLGGADGEFAEALIRLEPSGASERYAFVGRTESFGAGGTDAWLVALDAAGQPLWQRTLGGADNDLGVAVAQWEDGSIALLGRTWTFADDANDLLLARLSPGGEMDPPCGYLGESTAPAEAAAGSLATTATAEPVQMTINDVAVDHQDVTVDAEHHCP